MTIKEKMRELEKKNSWDKWSKKDKALYIKLTLLHNKRVEFKEKEFKD